MGYNVLTSTQEQNFTDKLSLKYETLSYLQDIIITDSTLSRRQVSTISNNIINTIEHVQDNQLIYIPICFKFQKLGDQKHRVILLFSNNTLEVFDCNGWEWFLDSKKYKNKQNLAKILNKVQQETDIDIFKYDYSLNCISGSCVTFSLLFVLYRINGVSIDDICEIFEFYESRNTVNFERKMDKLIKQKEFDWTIYHKIITKLINKESLKKKV